MKCSVKGCDAKAVGFWACPRHVDRYAWIDRPNRPAPLPPIAFFAQERRGGAADVPENPHGFYDADEHAEIGAAALACIEARNARSDLRAASTLRVAGSSPCSPLRFGKHMPRRGAA